jgi:hypothetical protein
MSRQHRRKQRRKLRSFYIWHRYMGVSAAVVILIVAVTGMLLNHTEDFQFDSEFIQTDWILDWYGIEAPDAMQTFLAGDRYITLMGEHLYLNRREIKGSYSQLVGAVPFEDMFIVAISNGILLLTARGELIEHLRDKDGVPAGLKQIGIDANGAVIVRSSHDYYQPDADFIRWKRREQDSSLGAVTWATESLLEPRLKTALQHHFRGEVLPVERVILDLHSGRFFGWLGPWLFDAAAILLILLALSGSWMWLKRRR